MSSKVPVVPATVVESEVTPILGASEERAVKGRWKTGLCDICIFPIYCMACCFPGVLAGQVFQRAKLNVLGCPSTSSSSKTCYIMTGIFLFVMITNSILTSYIPEPDLDDIDLDPTAPDFEEKSQAFGEQMAAEMAKIEY